MRTHLLLEKALGENISQGLEKGEFSVFYRPQLDFLQNALQDLKRLSAGMRQAMDKFLLPNSYPWQKRREE